MNLLLPLAPTALTPVAAADGIDNYSQCQIGNPSSGLDCENWINGILNATHNNYSEDEVVPQRLIIDFDDTDNHSVTISYMARKTSGTAAHAYDYLATWNHTYVNADRCQDLGNPALCVGGAPDFHDIPSDTTSVTPGGPQPTSAHELPQANRQFVMYGGDITSTSAITHSTDPSEDGSDYGNITINFDVTDADGRIMLLFGGHLASGFGPRGWGPGLGAAGISGGPYHIRVTALDSESIGNRDNQIMSDAIEPLPGLEIAKTTTTPVISAGETASYTVTITNSGQGDATGVVVSDTLPAGIVWSETPDNANCTITSGTSLSCGPLTIAAASSFSVTVTGTTDSADCPSILNRATFTSTNGGSGASAPEGQGTQITINCPTIRVEKTPDESTQDPGANDINVGSAATFTITVFNDGAGTASGVNVFDDLPGTGWSVVGGASTTLASCAVSDPADGEHAAKGEILTCGPDTIAANSSKKVTVSKTTATADCGEIDNTATASATNNGSDSDPGNIDVRCPSVRVEKTPDENELDPTANNVSAGDPATFTVTVFNDGTAPATSVNLFDDLPGTGWSVVAGETTLTDCAVTDPSAGEHADKGEILTCGPDSIDASASKKVAVTKTTATADCGEIDNTASVTAGNGAGDSDTGNIDVLCPSISVEKTPDDGVVDAPDSATFTIVATNGGLGVARDAEIFDDLPEVVGGWSLGTVPAGDTAWQSCEVTDVDHGVLGDIGEWLTCGPEDIEAGGDRTVVVTASVTTDDCGALPNEADVLISNGTGDEDGGLITVQCPDLDIIKTADAGTVDAGGDIGFSITVANSDAAGTGDAFDVTLNDPLPGSLALGVDWSIDAVLLNGVAVENQTLCEITGSPATETLECDFGTLEPGDDYEVQLSSGTSAPEGCLTADLVNEATADASNHAAIDADATITVQCPDLDIIKTADADVVSAGEQIGFTVTVTNSDVQGTGTAMDVTLEDDLPAGGGIDWSVAGVSINGVAAATPADWCAISGTPPTEKLECDFDDLGPGDSASVHVVSGTTAESCATYDNTAVADALNADDVTSLEATVTVECPGLNLLKQADVDPIDAGEEASFTITVWNNGGESGNAEAFDVELHDDLPAGLTWDFEIVSGDATDSDCMLASSVVNGGVVQMSIDCDFGTVGPTDMAGGIVIRIFAETERADCGLLENTAEADGSNLEQPLTSSDSILVKCPTIELDKRNDAVGSVLPGSTVTYTLTLTVEDGPAENVTVVDEMPVGLEDPTEISNGGTFDSATNTITWDLGDLADGEYTVTYKAIVADDVEHGEELVNAAFATSTNSQCPDVETLGPECEAESTVLVRVPTLVIDKVASTETITISGPNDALVATPSVVTWTLSYTLTNGPVTNAVITDPVPTGFTFLDASNGGTFSNGTITWNLGTLSASGSVTFRTTVNPATISRVAPTVNIATIDSNETAPDTGQDSVRVVVEPPPLAGTPTPRPSLPNTASGIGPDGTPVTVPIELLAVFFIGSLGALALANVKARSRRR